MRILHGFVFSVAALLLAAAATSLAEGDEQLGTPSIAIAEGTGIAVGGVGLSGADGTGTIKLMIPAGATVKQVLLYWHGFAPVPGGTVDEDFMIEGIPISGGTPLSAPVFFNVQGDPEAAQYSFAYRRDITNLGIVGPGLNELEITELDAFTHVTNGAGILAIYQVGPTGHPIDIRDGNDVAYFGWIPEDRGSTVAQTFTFPPAPEARVASLFSFVAAVAGEASGAGPIRPTSIEVRVGGSVHVYSNELGSFDGEEWDSWTKQVMIPAGETELEIEVFSREDPSPTASSGGSKIVPAALGIATALTDANTVPLLADLPASLVWLAAGLSIAPTPPPGDEGCTPGYWKQSHHFGNWPAPYTPQTLFGDVFDDVFPGKTLHYVLSRGGGGLIALGRHTVAALLNSASAGVEYSFTPAYVIERFNEVHSGVKDDWEDLKDMFEDANEAGCPLGRAELEPEPKDGDVAVQSTRPVLRNYPNPFNPSTTIEFTIPESGSVTLTVYSVLGQRVRSLVNREMRAGTHLVTWDALNDAGEPMPSGLYIYRLVTGSSVEIQKMNLVR